MNPNFTVQHGDAYHAVQSTSLVVRLTSLILAQGIVSNITIDSGTNLIQDLHYKPFDIRELLVMMHKEFNLRQPIPREYAELSQIQHLIYYIQQNM